MINLKKLPGWVKIGSAVTVCIAVLGIGSFFGAQEYMKHNQKNETSVVSGSSDSQNQPETSHGSNQEKSHDNAENDENKKSVIVYKTKTGNKYHKDGCPYLSKSKIEITLEEAENEKLEPCKNCFGE